MKNIFQKLVLLSIFLLLSACEDSKIAQNTSALDEQVETEINQKNLFKVQPPPKISWSLERDNLIKRFKLQNDRTIMFYMYVFIEGDRRPIGYYQVNKVSSVNSQLTNTQQVIRPTSASTPVTLPSPAEDGSYGENGTGIFGFTPNDIYLEHNMKYIVSTVPLSFPDKTPLLTNISVADEESLKKMMAKLK